MSEEELVCDFCSSPSVAARFDAKDTTVAVAGLPLLVSEGDWCACLPCHDFIVDERWDELEKHCSKAFAVMYPDMTQEFITMAVKTIHKRFREARK